MAAKMNIIDRIDTLRANSVTDEQFRATWGMSLNEHIAKMMSHVQKTDARIREEREHIERHD